ncbi:MAG: FKBP-type peptidyl-prolyl cis-trans isomerase [Candidatus Angelobacter sp.]
MRKPFFVVRTILTAVAVLLGSAVAQQSTTNSQSAPAKTPSTTPAKTQQAAPAKSDAPAPKSDTAFPFATKKEKVSYALGMNIGESLHRQPIDVDPDVLAQGLKDAMAGGKTKLTDDEVKATLIQLQTEMRGKQEEQMKQATENNKKEGEAFLAANKTKAGVVTLPSGLQYKILTEGKGPKPTASDTVVCNYRGTLINGTEFDSSYKRGEPATFPVGGVIKGWTEALQLMPVGSKWQLFIPSEMAYGARGAGGEIGPNATLIFEVELISIQGKNPPAADKAPGDKK